MIVLRPEKGSQHSISTRKSNTMAETSLQMATPGRDQSLMRTQVSSRMEARPAAERHSTESDVDVISIQVHEEVQEESSVGEQPQEETLESQINIQQNRRRFLRHMQREMVSSVNAYAVVLVLLASVTFIGFLQPPGGLDESGHLKLRGHSIKRFITFIITAFYLAVAGILVCMSCIAFIFPRATKYAKRSLTAKWKRKYSSVGPVLNSDECTLKFEVRTNDKVSRTLKYAHIQEILANLFFVVSLFLTVLAFRKSAEAVIDEKELHILTSQYYWRVINFTFETIFCIYIFRLSVNIFKAAKDLVVDLQRTAKRLSFRSVRRFGTFRTFS